ncbi:Bifunctional inhibitor/lipid-transfer protein/seed storage 2S albumin superfamily protein [Tripterygium wilfordii]|uniref:Bifunctional inhibitor/lipid-transfer protein/seed storage 2S albumin superfamily protein n=1 Tax=Tripterygium wilfordii TaxID=458696 RepID=A0A7J7D0W8_TRIWF|nr:Bifunctional inhibitor/lipid-transfer protein/seed storage 2S albumin superfamily protein [Tripterygium wilfordii]
MSKLWVVWLISTTWVVMLGNAAPSPSSPSVDCSTVIFDMLDCVPFLSDGSTQTKPTPGCCSGYQSVISVDPECICFAIKSSGDMGIKLNITKAMTLPSACGLPAPPVDCGTALPPSGSAPAPATPPPPSPSPPSPPSPSPSPAAPSNDEPAPPSDGGSSEAPAPSAPTTKSDGIYSTSVSLVAVISMIVASVSYIFM